MKPILKWAGGKRWLAKRLTDQFPPQYETYIEPFLGGGAVFFEMRPESAILSDANASLIETYVQIRDNPDKVAKLLARYQEIHSESVYYQTRSSIPEEPDARAARFIYLNRTCWNGLFRVNKNNQFNVPIGTKTKIVAEDDDFLEMSKLLAGSDIVTCDFEATIERAKKDDLVFVDPPYTVKHNMNGFVKYNQNIFSWEDQLRLYRSLVKASERGCHIFVTNADHQSIRDLYANFGTMESVSRSSIIAGSSSNRGLTTELLVSNRG